MEFVRLSLSSPEGSFASCILTRPTQGAENQQDKAFCPRRSLNPRLLSLLTRVAQPYSGIHEFSPPSPPWVRTQAFPPKESNPPHGCVLTIFLPDEAVALPGRPGRGGFTPDPFLLACRACNSAYSFGSQLSTLAGNPLPCLPQWFFLLTSSAISGGLLVESPLLAFWNFFRFPYTANAWGISTLLKRMWKGSATGLEPPPPVRRTPDGERGCFRTFSWRARG